MYRHRRLLITLTGLVAAAAPVLGMSTTSSAAPPTPAPRVTVVHLSGQARTPLEAGTLTRQRAGSGYERATLATGAGRRFTVSGPEGSTAVLTETQSADGRTGSADLSIQTPDDKVLGVDPVAKAQAYAASGRSVVVEAMAAGIPYEQAVAEFGDMDPDSVPTKARALAALGATATPNGPTRPGTTGSSSTTATPSRSSASRPPTREEPDRVAPAVLKTGGAPMPYDSACADIYYGREQYSHACDVRYLDYARSGQWYLSHKMKVSAAYDSFWSALTSANVYVVYGSGGTGNGGKGTMWADFDPYTTEAVGRCGTWTAGVQDPKTGANIAYSGTICPSSIGPVWTARAQRTYKGYGAVWRGRSSSAKGAVAAGVVNNPSGSTASRGVRTHFAWSLK
jgi:hypothetical protein